MRDCQDCKHYVEKVEVGKGSSPEHYFGCDSWECEFEPTTKNDLGVDCIDRAKAQTEIEMNAFRYTLAKERGGMGQVEWSDQLIKVSDAVGIIRDLPSVTPQEPRKDYLSIDDVMSVFDDFMCGEVDEDSTETFLEMLKDKADRSVEDGNDQ